MPYVSAMPRKASPKKPGQSARRMGSDSRSMRDSASSSSPAGKKRSTVSVNGPTAVSAAFAATCDPAQSRLMRMSRTREEGGKQDLTVGAESPTERALFSSFILHPSSFRFMPSAYDKMGV